jgi:hypothetical protein
MVREENFFIFFHRPEFGEAPRKNFKLSQLFAVDNTFKMQQDNDNDLFQFLNFLASHSIIVSIHIDLIIAARCSQFAPFKQQVSAHQRCKTGLLEYS